MNNTVPKSAPPPSAPQKPKKPEPAAPTRQPSSSSSPAPRDQVRRSNESHEPERGPSQHVSALMGNFAPASTEKPADAKGPPDSKGSDRGEKPLTIVGDKDPKPTTDPKLAANVPPYVQDPNIATRTGPNGENVTETSYNDNGVQVQHIATENPDGSTRIEEVRTTANGVERSVTDRHTDERPVEELMDPASRDKLNNNTLATGERSPTEVTHTVRTVTNNGVQPPQTNTLQDTTAYQQQIQAKPGELWSDGKAVVPGGQPMTWVPGVANLEGAAQTVTYTTGTQTNPDTGAQESLTSLSSELKVRGRNDNGGPAEISQTLTENIVNGQASGTKTNEFKGFLTKEELNSTSLGLIPTLPDEFARKLDDGTVDVRETITLDANGKPTGSTAEFGNYAKPGQDGATVALTSQEGAPTALSLTKVSESGKHIQSQTVMQGTKLSTVSDTRTDGQIPPTSSTRSETYNDGKLVSRTSQGTRPVPASQSNEPPLDGVTFDAQQRDEFLRRVGNNTRVSETYSDTVQFLDDGTTVDQSSVSHNVSYQSENGITLSATSKPVALGQNQRTGELREWGPHGPANPSEIGDWQSVMGSETATTLSDPNSPLPTSVATSDWKGNRQYFTEAATGAVQRDGVRLEVPQDPSPTAVAKKNLDGLLRPGTNLARAALGSGNSKALGVLSAGLAYANVGHSLIEGQLPGWKDTLSATTGTGTLAKLHKPLEGLGKTLGYVGYGLTGVTGLTQIAEGNYKEGGVNTAIGIGGILTTVGGSVTGPLGWGILLGAGIYSVATAEDPNATVPLEI